MRTLIVLCVITLATAGCGSAPVREIQTVEVRVPVPVPCVDSVPALPKSSVPDPGAADTAQLAAGAVTDAINYRLYAEKSRALLLKCAKPPEG